MSSAIAAPGLGEALYEEMRARIADGTYRPGTALPSTRALAAERGCSRTTVSAVYDQLAADGFIDRRGGAVSRVAEGAAPLARPRPGGRRRPAAISAADHPGHVSAIGTRIAALGLRMPPPLPPGEIDFVYGPLAGQDFPVLPWLKALRAAGRQRVDRLAYEDPRGHLALRQALQAHLSQSRGLACEVDQLMIVNGSQQALDLCARLLVDPGDQVLVENPGYRMAHHAFATQGAEVLGVEVDAQGLATRQLPPQGHPRLLYVTPTHQFPLGGFLPIGRRRELLAWAAGSGAWIVEDDYDGEYRHAVRPEATLWSLDTAGCVIHVGTFSKTLSPQLRLGYLVLPRRLIDLFVAAKALADRHAATGTQGALAVLLADGTYDRHVRRIRRRQQARQAALVAALDRWLGGQIVVEGAASGLHLVVRFPALGGEQEGALIDAARARGVRVYPLGPFYLPGTAPSRRVASLVMGYALLDEASLNEGVRRLAAAVADLADPK